MSIVLILYVQELLFSSIFVQPDLLKRWRAVLYQLLFIDFLFLSP